MYMKAVFSRPSRAHVERDTVTGLLKNPAAKCRDDASPEEKDIHSRVSAAIFTRRARASYSVTATSHRHLLRFMRDAANNLLCLGGDFAVSDLFSFGQDVSEVGLARDGIALVNFFPGDIQFGLCNILRLAVVPREPKLSLKRLHGPLRLMLSIKKNAEVR